MPKLMLDRQTLARLLQNDHQAIVAFEKMLGDVGEGLPSTLEEVTALASMASALSNLVLAMLEKTDEQLELLRGLPTPVSPPIDDSYTPALSLGTIGQQNAESVEITGGSIDGATIGATLASTGAFTALSATGQITSMLATGTAPLVVASVTKVANLNADLLDGTDWAAPGTIGGTTPAAASFTTINASGQIISTLATGTAPLVIASTTNVPNLNASTLNGATFASPGAIGGTAQNTIFGSSFKCPYGGTLLGLTASSYLVQAETSAIVRSYSVGNNAATYGSHEHYACTSTPAVQLVYTATNAGFKVALAFGCNGAAPQTAVASGAALAAYAGGANGLSVAADMQALVDKVIAMDAALKANGILS